MGIPGFPFLRDFRDPVVIIGIPFSTQTADDAYATGRYSQVWKHVRCRMAKYEVANSSEELHSDEQSADRFSFTAAIYNYHLQLLVLSSVQI